MPDGAQLDHDGGGEIIDLGELVIEGSRDRWQVTTPQDRLRGAVERRLVMVERGDVRPDRHLSVAEQLDANRLYAARRK
jgi:hypothetical protein